MEIKGTNWFVKTSSGWELNWRDLQAFLLIPRYSNQSGLTGEQRTAMDEQGETKISYFVPFQWNTSAFNDQFLSSWGHFCRLLRAFADRFDAFHNQGKCSSQTPSHEPSEFTKAASMGWREKGMPNEEEGPLIGQIPGLLLCFISGDSPGAFRHDNQTSNASA